MIVDAREVLLNAAAARVRHAAGLLEAVRGTGWDCGRSRPLGECGVLAVCCRPHVGHHRFVTRCALWAVTSDLGGQYARSWNGWPQGPGLDAPARRMAA